MLFDALGYNSEMKRNYVLTLIKKMTSILTIRVGISLVGEHIAKRVSSLGKWALIFLRKHISAK